jgi:hypothetical protein
LKRITLFIATTTMLALSACESKFVETSPSAVGQDGATIEDRMKDKSAMDTKINEIDQMATKIRNIVDLFRKIKNPEAGKDNYTAIDFMLELNGKLKDKMPSKCEDTTDQSCYFRKTSFEMPIKELSEDCRIIEALLESKTTEQNVEIWSDDSFWGAAPETKSVKTDKFTYSLKTCNAQDKYQDVIEIYLTEGKISFEVNNKNLQKLFNQILLAEDLSTTNCKIQKTEKNLLSKIQCSDIQAKLNESETAVISKLIYNNDKTQENRLEVNFDLFENSSRKASFELVVPFNGEPHSRQLEEAKKAEPSKK